MSISEQISQAPLGWVALRHFLPTSILRELIVQLVRTVSEGEVSFDALFDEWNIPSAVGLDGWVVQPRKVDGKLSGYLQHTIQNFVWQADGDNFPPEDGVSPSQRAKARQLEQAIALGVCDFGFDERRFRADLDDKACNALLDLLRVGYSCVAEHTSWSDVPNIAADRVRSLPQPLAWLILKHIGDLCADADAWVTAEQLYRRCRAEMDAVGTLDWIELTAQLVDLVDQSIAAAVRINAGPEAASTLLRSSLQDGPLAFRPLLKLNASFDAHSASLSVDSGILAFDDRRTAFLRPPLNHASHQLSWSTYALVGSQNRNGAWRRCWAVLRRQLALGLSTESRDTMGAFARVLIRIVDEADPRHSGRDQFILAVKFLVQAADRSGADEVVWPERLVNRFVDEASVQLVIDLCQRHSGISIERHRAAIFVLTKWAEKISQDRQKAARLIFCFLSEQAQSGQISFFSGRSVGLAGLEALLKLAKARPELCRNNISEIHSAIVSRVRSQTHWNVHAKSIELACDTIDMFSDDQTRELVESLLPLLVVDGAGTQSWPLVNPALQCLLSDEVVSLANRDASFGRSVVNTILLLGSGGGSDAVGLVQYLERFDSALFEQRAIDQLGEEFVQRLIPSVKRYNTSSNASEIRALLAIPSISGDAGLVAAIEALEEVLKSAGAEHPALSLADVYAAVLALAGRKDEFVSILGPEYVSLHWKSVLQSIYNVWSAAIQRPALLAPFSIPGPTAPNQTTVHNWTYASLRLARDLGEEEKMLGFLKGISPSHPLRDAIDLAIATGAVSPSIGDYQDLGLDGEGDEAFYAGLGRRLVRVLVEEQDVARRICDELLQQCLRRGPRGLDAAVFAQALRLKVPADATGVLVQDYVQRLNGSASLRLSIWPLLAALR